jgi:hypothetical protein
VTRNIIPRLKKLESLVPRMQTDQERIGANYSCFLWVNVAFYLGNPSPDEAPATAHARALGYADGYEYRMALEGNDPTLNERYAQANTRLFAKFGSSPDDRSKAFGGALERMEAGLTEKYKKLLLSLYR